MIYQGRTADIEITISASITPYNIFIIKIQHKQSEDATGTHMNTVGLLTKVELLLSLLYFLDHI